MLVASPICGWLSDKVSSRRLFFTIGIVVLAASTTLLWIGTSISVLLIGRLLGGFSNAITWTAGPGLIVDTVGKQDVGEVMGYLALSFNVALLVGPTIGGVVFKQCGYSPIFALAFAVVVVDLVLRLLLVDQKTASKWKKDESKRNSNYWTWSHNEQGQPMIAETAKMRSIARLSWRASIFVEAPPPYSLRPSLPPPTPPKHRSPILTLLRSRRLLTALWATVVNGVIVCSFDAVLPIFVNKTFGWSSTGAGLVFMALILPDFLSPLAGSLSDKHGGRWFATAGFVIAAPALILLRLVPLGPHDAGHAVLLCVLLAIIGVGMTVVQTPVMAEVTYMVEEKERKQPGLFGDSGAYGLAYGLWNAAFGLGSFIGPIWAGYTAESLGWGTMGLMFGLLSAATAVPTAAYTGGAWWKVRREKKTNTRPKRAPIIQISSPV